MAQESKELVPVASARPPDAYEAKYMAGEGTVLHRDKSRAPWQIHAIFAVAGLAMVGGVVASGALVGLAIGLPLLALVWLFFSVLRVTVSEGLVNVQYGLVGPKIPIAAIESAEAIRYDWKKYGGWGIRYADGEWIYNMPGDGGHAVRVVWRDAKGQRRVTLVGSRRADEVAQQIAHAQRALPPAARRGELPPGT
jgi:hypothetical protein